MSDSIESELLLTELHKIKFAIKCICDALTNILDIAENIDNDEMGAEAKKK